MENVPKGHGRNLPTESSFPGIRLNPEASKAAIKARLLDVSGLDTLTSSSFESRGFLKKEVVNCLCEEYTISLAPFLLCVEMRLV